MSHSVFLVATVGAPRDHHAIFVETDRGIKSGTIVNVTGNIQTGMEFQERWSDDPESADTFVEKWYLGEVRERNVDQLRAICRGNPAPKKQFDGAKRLFPKEPLRRCQEWTAETIEMLKSEGILLSSGHAAAEELKGDE